jgi:hypothetical protein
MNAPPTATAFSTDKGPAKTQQQVRRLELGPALKREQLLQRVRAVSKRLPQTSSDALARLR